MHPCAVHNILALVLYACRTCLPPSFPPHALCTAAFCSRTVPFQPFSAHGAPAAFPARSPFPPSPRQPAAATSLPRRSAD